MIDRISAARKQFVTGHLEGICQHLELSENQYETAEKRYGVVGEWLASSEDTLLSNAKIYPQGSISLGTSVKPMKGNEYDVDLVCFVPYISGDFPPRSLKKLIGNRLSSNGRYEGILEEKPRCWRLTYANEFHLDITPSIRNPACFQGGELIPDKIHDEWTASNPKGYLEWFREKADLQPSFSVLEKAEAREFAASIEPFPDQGRLFKGILRRCVQICKRHRDEYFHDSLSDVAPISIILTTLAANSYAYCVTNYGYDSEFDVLIDVIRYMPHFINISQTPEGVRYSIMNETTKGENFAEKWNKDSRLAEAFYLWQKKAAIDLENLAEVIGLDNLQKSMNVCFGESVVSAAFEKEAENISVARNTGMLSVAPLFGLATRSSANNVPVHPHTFFGR
jgi:hypothetical protein